MAKIEYNFKEFTEPDPNKNEHLHPTLGVNAARVKAFIQLHTTRSWRELQQQFAVQLTVPDKVGGHRPQDFPGLSDEQFEKAMQRIEKHQELPSKNKKVVGQVDAPDLSLLGWQAHELYIQHFGYERFFECMRINARLDPDTLNGVLGLKRPMDR